MASSAVETPEDTNEQDTFLPAFVRFIHDAVDPGATPDELADALYLAALFPPRPPAPSPTDTTSPGAASGPIGVRPPQNKPVSPAPSFDTTPTEGGLDNSGSGAQKGAETSVYADARAAIKEATADGQNNVPPPRAIPATGVRIPSGRALSDPLGIERALRPLMRRVPSRTRMALDLEATVERAAHDGVAARASRAGSRRRLHRVWPPELRPEPARWLAVEVIEDDGQTMAPWRETVNEFVGLLERSGGFRTVRRWRMDAQSGDRVRLWRFAPRGGANREPVAESTNRSLERLRRAEPQNADSRIVLVLTDCAGGAWHKDAAWSFLAGCGLFAASALIQMLPETLWARTATRPVETLVGAVEAGVVNRQLSQLAAPPTAAEGQTLDWLTPPQGNATTAPVASAGANRADGAPIPIPCLSLLPSQLAAWARLVAGRGGVSVPAVLAFPPAPDHAASGLERGEPVASPPQTESPAAASLRQAFSSNALPDEIQARLRVESLRGASPTAQRLALLLTAAQPLCLPVIRVVRDALLPNATEGHIAEVLMSGLLRQVETGSAAQNIPLLYEWRPGVQKELQKGLRRNEATDVVSSVTEWIMNRAGSPRDFGALIPDPAGTATLTLTGDTLPFARLSIANLRGLGLADEAARLEERVGAFETVTQERVPPGLSLQHTLRGHQGIIFRAAWSPDGHLLATPGVDGTIRIWNGATGELLTTISVSAFGVNQVSWSPESPDGCFLAAACYDRMARVWEIGAGGRRASLYRELKAHNSEVRTAVWSPDGALLATGTRGGSVKFWNTTHWSRSGVARSAEWNGVHCAAWSPNADVLALGCDNGYVGVIKRNNLNHAQNRDNLGLFTGQASEGRRPLASITALAYSPLNSILVAGNNDGDLFFPEIRNPDTGRGIAFPRDRKAHSHTIMALTFSPDESVLVSKGADGMVRFWRCDDTPDWKLVDEMPEPIESYTFAGLAWNPKFPTLATLTDRGHSVRLWQVDRTRLSPEPVRVSVEPVPAAPAQTTQQSSPTAPPALAIRPFLEKETLAEKLLTSPLLVRDESERLLTSPIPFRAETVFDLICLYQGENQYQGENHQFWLAATTRRLFCLVDDHDEWSEDNIVWHMALEDADPVDVHSVDVASENMDSSSSSEVVLPMLYIGQQQEAVPYSEDRFPNVQTLIQEITGLISRALSTPVVKTTDLFVTYNGGGVIRKRSANAEMEGYTWFRNTLRPELEIAGISLCAPTAGGGIAQTDGGSHMDRLRACRRHLVVLMQWEQLNYEAEEEVRLRVRIGERSQIIFALVGNAVLPEEFADLPAVHFLSNQSSNAGSANKRAFDELLAQVRFLTEQEIKATVAGRISNGGEESVQSVLNIFRTRTQRTYLVTTTRRLFCLLDDANTRVKNRLIQWDVPLEKATPVEARNFQSSKTGQTAQGLTVGSQTRLFYSRQLFPDARKLEETIYGMIRTAQLAGLPLQY